MSGNVAPSLHLGTREGARLVGQRAARSGRTQGAVQPLRLTRRGRMVAVAVAVTLLACLAMVGGGAAASAPAGRTIDILVEPGASLWSLAAEIARPGEDIRDVVREIQLVNGRDSAQIRAGDVIRLPIR